MTTPISDHGAMLEPQLYAAENRRFQIKPPGSLDAWGHVMRAMPRIWTWGEEDSETALEDLRRAIAIEPNYDPVICRVLAS